MRSQIYPAVRDVYIVSSSTTDNKYIQYVHEWMRTWRLYGKRHNVNIQPLVFVPMETRTNSEKRKFFEDKLPVYPIEQDNRMPAAFQAQAVRLLAPRYASLPSTSLVVSSDIDMFPGTDDFFVRLFLDTPPDSFLVARDVLSERFQYPMCYLSATAETWDSAFKSVLNLHDVWLNWSRADNPSSSNWFIDQFLAYRMLQDFRKKQSRDLKLWTDSMSGHVRLDRAVLGRRAIWLACSSSYSDYHAHRRPAIWRTIVRALQWRLLSSASE